MTIRIAMWSGPRNISTAMMRAWENRPDCLVVDEPFYACYLSETGRDHPMRQEVIASQSTDWSTVVGDLTQDGDVEIFYQKHMTHHMLPHVDLDWTTKLQHCFLIRNPLEVVNSYAQKRETVTAADIGIIRQLELYNEITQITGQQIPVIDSKTFLIDPRSALVTLCAKFDIRFVESMLSWPPGRRDSDGVWASHWYHAVEQSTGFEPYRERELKLTQAQQDVALESEDAYLALLSYSRF